MRTAVAFALVVLAAASAVPAQELEAMKPGRVFRDCPECPEMVVVPAGSFMMGSPEGEEGRQSDEGPQHKVTIAKPFAVGRYEVTRGEFAVFARESGHAAGDTCFIFETGKLEKRAGLSFRNPGFDQDDRHPVVCVSWDDATAFAGWLSKKVGKTYRLMSEAEWEYAARAASTDRYHFGDDEKGLCAYGNVADQSLKEKDRYWTRAANCKDGYVNTAPAGSLKPNAFGLHDMHGNVWEWVQDCYRDSYAGAPPDGSAVASGDCDLRVMRGGSFGNIAQAHRLAYRYPFPSDNRSGNVGFRLARMHSP